MSTRSELKAFLITNLATQLASDFPPGTGNIYFGRDTRVPRKDREIFLRYDTRTVSQASVGRLVEHIVDIELYQSRYDRISSDEFQSDIEEASLVLVEAYDDNVVLFRANITKLVEKVTCAEVTPVIISPKNPEKRVEGSKVIRLSVETWET